MSAPSTEKPVGWTMSRAMLFLMAIVVGSVPTETEPGGEDLPALSLTGDATAGADVFASAGCGSCHTLSAAGSTGTVGPNLDDAKPPAALVVERVTNGMGAMPPFKGQLSDAEIQAVADYVSSVAGK